jgi:hypothetical protein
MEAKTNNRETRAFAIKETEDFRGTLSQRNDSPLNFNGTLPVIYIVAYRPVAKQ